MYNVPQGWLRCYIMAPGEASLSLIIATKLPCLRDKEGEGSRKEMSLWFVQLKTPMAF